MCEECREHGVDCTELNIKLARPEQLRRLLRDILNPARHRHSPKRGEGQA